MAGGDRYDPLPGLTGLPAHVWRRLSRRGRRIAGAAAALAVAGLAVAFILAAPGIRESKEERAASEQRQREESRRERLAAIRRDQRPVSASGPAAAGGSAAERLRAREELVRAVSASILADARARADRAELDLRILRTECEPFPRTAAAGRPERHLSRRTGRYDCLAVTSDIAPTRGSGPGTIGYPFRVLVDFRTGRYTWCRISGRPGEGSIARDAPVGVPRACGG